MSIYKREPYEKRLLRILNNAGYTAQDLLHLSVEEMLTIEHITVPNIRTILFLQRKLRKENQQKVRTTTYGKKHK